VIIAGPNGAGKTTFAQAFLPNEAGCSDFLNADLIARGLSPFNAEKTPSFYVNDQKQFYHDFSSGKSGDVFRFLMEVEGLSFPEAVEKLAHEAGLDMPRQDAQSAAREKARASLHEVLAFAAETA